MRYKQPYSVLVVIYLAASRQVLMLQRRDDPTFWQSVTGSIEPGEEKWQTAVREVKEETGIDIIAEQLPLYDCQHCVDYPIFAQFRHRYPPGVQQNREHWFCLPLTKEPDLILTEHTAYRWCSASEAAKLAKSPSNGQAISQYVMNNKESE